MSSSLKSLNCHVLSSFVLNESTLLLLTIHVFIEFNPGIDARSNGEVFVLKRLFALCLYIWHIWSLVMLSLYTKTYCDQPLRYHALFWKHVLCPIVQPFTLVFQDLNSPILLDMWAISTQALNVLLFSEYFQCAEYFSLELDNKLKFHSQLQTWLMTYTME